VQYWPFLGLSSELHGVARAGMSLHGSGQTEGERTLPLPPTAPATLPGSWTPGPGGWQPWGGWPPPLPPPRRGRAALVVIGVVLAVALLAVAFSFAVVGTSPRRRVATSANNPPAASPLVSPSTTEAPAVSLPPPEASEAPTQAPATAPRVLTAPQIAAAVDPSVVDVNTVLGPGSGSAAGTGIVLSSTGEILTNNHVIDGYSSITVFVPGTRKTYPATLVGRVVDQDVALLQVQGVPGLTPAPVGNSAKVMVGDAVVALGNALGRAGTPQASQGLVIALNRNIVATDQSGQVAENLGGLIETSAALQPGDSGGPLVDAAGEVIGMDTAASTRLRFNANGGIGFAIPINQALDIVRQIRSGGGTTPSPAPPPAPQRGFLGVEVQADGGQGALVAGVLAGSPADAAGLAAGDVIVAVDGAAVDSPTTLTSILSAHRPGDQVRVTWMDALGLRFTASITLAAQS